MTGMWLDVKDIKVIKPDRIPRIQVEAIKDLTRTEYWRDFHPILLNQDYEERYVDAFAGTTWTKAQLKQLERLALNGTFTPAGKPLKSA